MEVLNKTDNNTLQEGDYLKQVLSQVKTIKPLRRKWIIKHYKLKAIWKVEERKETSGNITLTETKLRLITLWKVEEGKTEVLSINGYEKILGDYSNGFLTIGWVFKDYINGRIYKPTEEEVQVELLGL